MTGNTPLAPPSKSQRSTRYLLAVASCLALGGSLLAPSTQAIIGYLLVLASVVLPTWLWLRRGAIGIPVLPVAAAMHFLYYGVPLIRGETAGLSYLPEEGLTAAVTVAIFLSLASLSWWVLSP